MDVNDETETNWCQLSKSKTTDDRRGGLLRAQGETHDIGSGVDGSRSLALCCRLDEVRQLGATRQPGVLVGSLE